MWSNSIDFDSRHAGVSESRFWFIACIFTDKTAQVLILSEIVIACILLLHTAITKWWHKSSPVLHILCLQCIMYNPGSHMATGSFNSRGILRSVNKKARLLYIVYTRVEKIDQ